MKRRSKSEIQSKIQVPEDSEYSEIKYEELLVPLYEHASVLSECSDSSDIISKDIVYNSVYEYNGDLSTGYHRDNYCIVPAVVPPMALTGTSYDLSYSYIKANIPRISTIFGLNYSPDILNSYVKLSSIVIGSYPDFTDILEASKCICLDVDIPEYSDSKEVHISEDQMPFDTNPSEYQCGPLDNVTTISSDISDEYAYAWPELWDMSTIVPAIGGGGSKPPPDDSSSSGGVAPAGTNVILCKVITPPTGSGGTAEVSAISVSGDGSVTPGKTYVVNLPSI